MRYLLALCLVLWGTTIKAEELPQPAMLHLTSGVICDELVEVEMFLTNIALENDIVPIGCGELRGVMRAFVTPLQWYEIPGYRLLLAKYEQVGTSWVQYGWMSFEALHNTPQGEKM
jgi:hypothetical protein